MKETVLITGAQGQLGKLLYDEFSKDYNVKGIDIISSKIIENNNYSQIDIRHFGDVYRVLDGVDYIIHTAALHGVDLKSRSNLEFHETNVTGTLNLLESSKIYGVKKFIFLSSSSIYGKSSENKSSSAWLLDENTPVNPYDIYDLTKLQGEQLCELYTKLYNLPTIRLRVAKFYEGPNKCEFETDKLTKGTDIKDVCQAIRLALECNLKDEVFNIASSIDFTEQELIDLVSNPEKVILTRYPHAAELFQKEEWVYPKSIKKVIKADKAKKLLGFKPEYSFESFLEKYNEQLMLTK